MLKHKLRRPPELPKCVLTSAAEVAKHRRAKDKRRRETPCWWIANGKECFRGDRCAFKLLVPQVKGQIASQTGVSLRPVWPQIVTETGRKYNYLVQLQSLFLDRP